MTPGTSREPSREADRVRARVLAPEPDRRSTATASSRTATTWPPTSSSWICAGQDASDARFLECRLARCSLDGSSLRRARILESLLAEDDGASVDLADSTWRDSHVSGGRLGAVSLTGATWTGVRVRGCHLGFLNLAGAHLEDVLFEGCEIGSLDARTAELDAVTFVGCTLDELNVSGATLRRVDLSGARLRSLIGVESLKGAIVSHEQLVDLAPLLAKQLGLELSL